jgi:UDP-glucose 4-epimerase
VDEHLCFAFAQRGLEVSILRYFNIFGPRMDPEGYGSVIARFLTQALTGSDLTVHGDGEQTRCFTYVTEAVEATVLAGTLPQAIGQVYNIGSNNETSINDLASTVIALTGAEVSTRHVPYEEAFGTGFYDTRRRVPDVSKAARELEWHASIDLTTGLRRILETWQVQR